MKSINMYEIRYYEENRFSKVVGFKHKLVNFKQACKIVKKLKKSKIDAFKAKLKIKVSG